MNGEQPAGSNEAEPTLGDKIRKLQRSCVDDWTTFAKKTFELSTKPGAVMQTEVYVGAWMTAWKDLFTGCAARFDELRQIIVDES